MKKFTIIAVLLSIAALAGCAAGNGGTQTPAAESPSDAVITKTEQASPDVTQTQQPLATAQPSQATAQAAYQTISPEDAKAMIGAEGTVLLDVRTQEEYGEAHIDGAQLIPYDAIEQNADELPADKDASIIVYCRSGRRSAIAAETLIGMGYANVYDLGGIQDWPYETVTG